MVLFAALTLLGKMDSDWKVVKKEMTDPKFCDKMLYFDKDNVSQAVLTKLRSFTRRDDFNPDIIKRNSAAAASIAKWVLAIDFYCAKKENGDDKEEQKIEKPAKQ